MEKILTLKEKFLLLSYQPESGNPYPLTQYHYGLIGAVLMELAESGKIKTENKFLKLIDQKNTGDKALDFVLEYLVKAERNKKVTYWVRKLSEFTIKRKLRTLILDMLIHKRILHQAEGRALLIFKYKKYPARETRTRNSLIKKIQNLILRRRDDDKDTILLAAFVGACDMTNKFFEKKDRKQANRQIKKLIKENQVAKTVNETVEAVQAAILATIVAATVVSGTGTH
jgi:hypothetical protein